MEVYTIGYSTRPIKEFINLLKIHEINLVVDVRSYRGSRYNPQYDAETLEKSLSSNHLGYVHIALLGGLRKPNKDSINTAWYNKSFRGYADYMQTKDFRQGLKELMELIKNNTVVIMCSEAVPWRCHRSLIGDALVIRSYKVLDIIGENNIHEHKLTAFAVVRGHNITYPE